MRIQLLPLAIALGCAALVPYAGASCVGANSVQNTGYIANVDWNGPYSFSDVPVAGSTFGARFWSAGSGDPATRAGNDSGSLVDSELLAFGGLPPYYVGEQVYNYANSFLSNWGAGGVDGCVNNDGPDACTCMLVWEDGGNGIGYFGLASAQRNATGDFIVPGDVVMGMMSRVQILSLDYRGDTTTADLMVTVPAPTIGLHLDPQCAGACTIGATYRVYLQLLPRGSPAPQSRIVASWQDAGAGDVPFGEAAMVNVDCGAQDQDLYLAAAHTFDSGFEPAVLSADTTLIQCGQNLAEPEPIRRRPLRPGTEGVPDRRKPSVRGR